MEKNSVTLHSRDFSEQDFNVAKQARELLENGTAVHWVNDYETFYGVGWFSWVKKQLEGVNCDIKVAHWCKWVNGMPWALDITPSK